MHANPLTFDWESHGCRPKTRGCIMSFKVRTAVCTAFLLILSTVVVFASNTLFNIRIQSSSDRIQVFRYRQGAGLHGPWTETSAIAPILSLEDFDPVWDRLFIQQSEDGESWGKVYAYRYDTVAQAWILAQGGESEIRQSISVYAVMTRSAASIKHVYETSYGGGIAYMHATPFHPDVWFVGELSVSGAASNNIFMDRFLILDIRFGLGYRIPLMKHLAILPAVTYGILTHAGAADFDDDGISEMNRYLDQQVRGSLGMELKLTENVNLVVKPEITMFFEAQGNVGVLYGIGAGLGYGWQGK